MSSSQAISTEKPRLYNGYAIYFTAAAALMSLFYLDGTEWYLGVFVVIYGAAALILQAVSISRVIRYWSMHKEQDRVIAIDTHFNHVEMQADAQAHMQFDERLKNMNSLGYYLLTKFVDIRPYTLQPHDDLASPIVELEQMVDMLSTRCWQQSSYNYSGRAVLEQLEPLLKPVVTSALEWESLQVSRRLTGIAQFGTFYADSDRAKINPFDLGVLSNEDRATITAFFNKVDMVEATLSRLVSPDLCLQAVIDLYETAEKTGIKLHDQQIDAHTRAQLAADAEVRSALFSNQLD